MAARGSRQARAGTARDARNGPKRDAPARSPQRGVAVPAAHRPSGTILFQAEEGARVRTRVRPPRRFRASAAVAEFEPGALDRLLLHARPREVADAVGEDRLHARLLIRA